MSRTKFNVQDLKFKVQDYSSKALIKPRKSKKEKGEKDSA